MCCVRAAACSCWTTPAAVVEWPPSCRCRCHQGLQTLLSVVMRSCLRLLVGTDKLDYLVGRSGSNWVNYSSTRQASTVSTFLPTHHLVCWHPARRTPTLRYGVYTQRTHDLVHDGRRHEVFDAVQAHELGLAGGRRAIALPDLTCIHPRDANHLTRSQ